MGIRVRTLTPQEVEEAKAQAQEIADSAKLVVKDNQFVFFAAFEGTNNDRNDLSVSNTKQQTNVAQLSRQVEATEATNRNLKSGYYRGPGTVGSEFGSSVFPTAELIRIANRAYTDFGREFGIWLETNPCGSATAMVTAFSRGGAPGAIFTQRLYAEGLVDPRTGKLLIPPGQVVVSAGVIFDPVYTLVQGNMDFVGDNIVVVPALDEFRVDFKAVNYLNNPGVTNVPATGNHGDVGGFNDRGLGALYLEKSTEFFAISGLTIDEVPADRHFNAELPIALHTEGVDGFGNRRWNEYGERGTRLINNKSVKPGTVQTFDDGSSITTFTNYEGKEISTGRDSNGTTTSLQVFDYFHQRERSITINEDQSVRIVITTPDGVDVTKEYDPRGIPRSYSPHSRIEHGSHPEIAEPAASAPQAGDAAGTVSAQQIERGGQIYTIDGHGDFARILGMGQRDVIDRVTHQRYLEDANGNRIAIGIGDTIGIDVDTGKAMVTALDAPPFVVPPNGSDLASDQYSTFHQQLGETATGLTDAQRHALTQHLAGSGLGRLSVVEQSDGTVVVKDAAGNTIGSVEPDEHGAVRYLNVDRDGIQLDAQGKSQQVYGGYTAEQAKAAFGGIQSALSFMQALEQGNELSALVSGVAMMNQFIAAGAKLPPELRQFGDTMNSVGAGLGLLSAGMNFADALESGDGLAILQSGTNLGAQGLNVYSIVTETPLFSSPGVPAGELGHIAQGLGTVAAGVGLITALQSGNPLSIASSGLSLLSTLGYIGPWGAVAAVVISIIGGMFGSDEPMLEGQARAEWDDNGHVRVVTTQDAEGGGATAANWMRSLVDNLQHYLASEVDANGKPLYQLIPQRLPSVGYQYDPDGFNPANGELGHLYLKWTNENGQEQTRYYDGAGSRGDGSGDSLVKDFMRHAAKAIVPGWEADTIRAHFRENNAQGRADANQAAAIPGANVGLPQEAADGITQRFTTLTFDITPPASATGATEAIESRALIDIDGDGYLERTDWVANNRAMLAIDLNGDSRITAGELLHRDPDSLARNSLNWLDATGDGLLSASDPAFAALRVWIDANGDGLTQEASSTSQGELQSLSAAGIAAIDFGSNPPRIVRLDGSSAVMTERVLTGDVKGRGYRPVEGGLLEAIERGETVLHAVNTRQFDGKAEHRYGGDEDGDGSSNAVTIDKNSSQLINTSANTVAGSTRRNDTSLASTDSRLTGGLAGVVATGQAGGHQAAVRIAAGSSHLQPNRQTFVSLGADSASREMRQVTENMVRTADNSLIGQGVSNGFLMAVGIGIGAMQWPGVAGAEPAPTNDASTDPVTPTEAHAQAIQFVNRETTLIAIGSTGDASSVLPIDEPPNEQAYRVIGKIVSNSQAIPPLAPIPVNATLPAASTMAGNATDLITTQAGHTYAATGAQTSRAEYSTGTAGDSELTANILLDYPAVVGELISGREDIGLRFPESLLLANDSTINTTAFPDQPPLRITAVGSPVHGQVALLTNADGLAEVVFIPDLNYHGHASYTYTVTDQYGLSSTATATLMLEAVNDAPVTWNEIATGDEDNILLFHAAELLANDRDVDTAVDRDVLRVTRVGQAEHGQVFLDASGTIRFIPDVNYNGPAQFTYWVADRDPAQLAGNGGEGYEIPASMHLSVIAVNDLPMVAGEQMDSEEDVVLDIHPSLLLANDRDVDTATNGQVLSITAVGNAQHGLVELLTAEPNAGTIRFTPARDYFGMVSFSYTVDDGNGGLVTGTAVINLAPVNDAPDVAGETITFNEDLIQTIDQAALLLNDSDVDNIHSDLHIVSVDNATHGNVALNPDGSIRFAPDADYSGAASFTYTVSDGVGGFTTGTATLDILPINDAPRLNGEAVTVDEDQVLHFSFASLLNNDIDVDNPHDTLCITEVSNASNGSVRLENGEIIFTPTLNFHGQASFTYTVADGVGGESQAAVNITFDPVNDAPVVNNELVWGKRNVTYTLTRAALLANDTDVETPSGLNIVGIRNAEHGTATLNANGSVTFVPDAGSPGRGRFEYIVQDPEGAATVGTAEIDFSRVNLNPVGVNDSFTGFEDTAFVINAAQLTVNDSDPDPTAVSGLAVDAVANATHGAVSLQANGSVRFMPDANFHGTATFDYRVNDGEGGTTWATSHLNVQSVNDAPVIEDIWYGRPIYGYQWVASSTYYDDGWPVQRWEWAPVTNESTARGLLQNPNDVVTLNSFEWWWGPTDARRNDLLDANGNAIGGNYYRNGRLRPISFNYDDATDQRPENEFVDISVDDRYRQNGSVIAYDPDGDSNALTFSISSRPQHGHAWANLYTPASTPSHLIDLTYVDYYSVRETGAWQYYSHRGDPYTGFDPFTVRVTDSGGAAVDAMIRTAHQGSSAGGGGKCPVVVDLSGNGVELIRPEDSNLFADINGDGWRERIGWAAASDGVLAYDVDHDGRIHRGDEVSFVGYKAGARTDLEGLAAFDTDGDGRLTDLDREWRSFGILQDINSNGVQDQGEFLSLDEIGIRSIGLERTGTPHLNNDNVVFGSSDVQFAGGRTTEAADVMFAGENTPLPDAVRAVLLAAQSPPSAPSHTPVRQTPEVDGVATLQTVATPDSDKEPTPGGSSAPVLVQPVPTHLAPSAPAEDAALMDIARIRQMALVFNQAVVITDVQPNMALGYLPIPASDPNLWIDDPAALVDHGHAAQTNVALTS